MPGGAPARKTALAPNGIISTHVVNSDVEGYIIDLHKIHKETCDSTKIIMEAYL